jgi:hypothetical protein
LWKFNFQNGQSFMWNECHFFGIRCTIDALTSINVTPIYWVSCYLVVQNVDLCKDFVGETVVWTSVLRLQFLYFQSEVATWCSMLCMKSMLCTHHWNKVGLNMESWYKIFKTWKQILCPQSMLCTYISRIKWDATLSI